jgi:hypothetical protein
MSFAKGPFRCLANDGKSFREDLIDGLPPFNSLFKFRSFGQEPVITERTDFGFQLVDFVDEGLNPFQLSFVFTAHDLLDQ